MRGRKEEKRNGRKEESGNAAKGAPSPFNSGVSEGYRLGLEWMDGWYGNRMAIMMRVQGADLGT